MKFIANLIGGILYIVAFFQWMIYDKQPDTFTVLTIILLAIIAFQNDKKKE